jgi:formate dehydrogenase maturation protein FdhE
VKIRQKPLSKGTGFIRDDHKFPVINQQQSNHMEIKKERFLNIEESDNLQDMINFAASISANKKELIARKDAASEFPVESLYAHVLTANANGQVTNEKLDSSISEILKRYFLSNFFKIKFKNYFKLLIKKANFLCFYL